MARLGQESLHGGGCPRSAPIEKGRRFNDLSSSFGWFGMVGRGRYVFGPDEDPFLITYQAGSALLSTVELYEKRKDQFRRLAHVQRDYVLR